MLTAAWRNACAARLLLAFVRLVNTFPPLTFLFGLKLNQLENCFSVGNFPKSAPTSDSNLKTVSAFTPLIRNRSTPANLNASSRTVELTRLVLRSEEHT